MAHTFDDLKRIVNRYATFRWMASSSGGALTFAIEPFGNLGIIPAKRAAARASGALKALGFRTKVEKSETAGGQPFIALRVWKGVPERSNPKRNGADPQDVADAFLGWRKKGEEQSRLIDGLQPGDWVLVERYGRFQVVGRSGKRVDLRGPKGGAAAFNGGFFRRGSSGHFFPVVVTLAKANPERPNPPLRRNHHVKVGGTFYTPAGRRGKTRGPAKDGRYPVRWADGTLGTVQDTEKAAYPAKGSRASKKNPSLSRGERILAGKVWQVYRADDPEKTLAEVGSRTAALEYIRKNLGGLRAFKTGKVRIAKVIMEPDLPEFASPEAMDAAKAALRKRKRNNPVDWLVYVQDIGRDDYGVQTVAATEALARSTARALRSSRPRGTSIVVRRADLPAPAPKKHDYTKILRKRNPSSWVDALEPEWRRRGREKDALVASLSAGEAVQISLTTGAPMAFVVESRSGDTVHLKGPRGGKARLRGSRFFRGGSTQSSPTMEIVRKNPSPKVGMPSDWRKDAKGWDIVEAGTTTYIRKDGHTVGRVQLLSGMPDWSPSIPRARDGAIKLPKSVIRAAMQSIGWKGLQNPKKARHRNPSAAEHHARYADLYRQGRHAEAGVEWEKHLAAGREEVRAHPEKHTSTLLWSGKGPTWGWRVDRTPSGQVHFSYAGNRAPRGSRVQTHHAYTSFEGIRVPKEVREAFERFSGRKA